MPFSVEDVRVLCHTRNASRIHGRLSGAEWVLASPVMPPNPNYKIKMHVTSMQVPNSFEHVGRRQNNDSVVIIRKWNNESYKNAMERGDYIKVEISTKDGHIANVRDYFESLETLEKAVNNNIVQTARAKPGWSSLPFVPQFRIDKKGYPLFYARQTFLGDASTRQNSKFDPDDEFEMPVDDGMQSLQNIVPGSNVEGDDSWVYFTKAVTTSFPKINWHTEPFFLFNIARTGQGFGFVIRGKHIVGKKEAYYLKNEKKLIYEPERENGYYPIEDDSYYMVVAMVQGDTGMNPVPEFNNHLREIPEDRPGAVLQPGDLRIIQLPFRSPTVLEHSEQNMKPFSKMYIVGPTLLNALNPDPMEGMDEHDEVDINELGEWHIFGYSGLEAHQGLDQAPHHHVKRGVFDLWDPPSGATLLFDDGFKTWYYRWAAHLYNSVTGPGTVLAQYKKFLYLEPSTQQVVETNPQYARRVNGKNEPFTGTTQPFTPLHVYPRTQFGETPYMDYEYKIVTGYDTIHDPETFTFDSSSSVSTGLADIIGFTRFAYTPGVNVPNTDLVLRLESPDAEPLSPLPRTGFVQDLDGKWADHVVTQAPCDFSGVRFIKVYTNMNINAIDSNGKDARLVAIMPTVGTAALESNYLLGSLQGSQTFTLGDTKIDRIRFDLTDDNGVPIEMYRDWWVDVTFSFEEPYNMDFYQGISKLINIGTRYTTEGYKYNDYSTITRDIGDEMDRIVSAETRNRRGNADIGTKRKHGAGGY
jgi:hypothetical protein